MNRAACLLFLLAAASCMRSPEPPPPAAPEPGIALTLAESRAKRITDLRYELRFSVLYNYNDGYFFEPDNVQRQGSYSLVYASAEYRIADKFGIEIWGRNLGNTKYFVQKISTSNIAVTGAAGAPRTYGVNLNFDF